MAFAPHPLEIKLPDRMNQTIYYRSVHNKENPYLQISRALIQDDRLSAIAVGLMVLILSNNDSFVLNVGHLKKVSKLTKTQFYKAWDSLQEYQYVLQRKSGKNSWHYIVNEAPITINQSIT